MLAAYSPFHGTDEDQLYKAIVNSEVKYPSHFSEESKACIKCLLERDPLKRLGMKTSPYGNIRENKFFSKIEWIKLQNRHIEPPFRPNVSGVSDTSNFDKTITSLGRPKLSKMDKHLSQTINNDIFKGFSFVGKNLHN